MIKFFRKIRQRMLTENKFSKYLLYAIGEIILVVIGILIALSINNWNQKKIQNNEILKIHQRITLDVDNDIKELSTILWFWKDKEPVFKKVVNDSISAELLDEGLSNLLETRYYINLNKTGIQQLKALNLKDELTLWIIESYDHMENVHLIPIENAIIEESKSLLKKIRDNYTWFPEYMSKTIKKDNSSKELQDYFLKSTEYRNYVIYANQQIFSNYIKNLERYISILEKIRVELKKISDSNFIEINKKNLEQFVGSYRVTKIEGDAFGVKIIDKNYQVTAHDNFLRFIDLDKTFFTYDYFFIKDKSFYSLVDGGILKLDFEAINSLKLNRFKMTIDVNNRKGVHYGDKLNVDEKVQQ